MIPNVQNTIQAAIRNRRRVVLRYDERSSCRIVEPHLLYRSDQGTMILLAWQVSGYHSSKRRESFWRPFQLRKINSISVSAELFAGRTKEGFDKVCKLIQGDPLARVKVDDPCDYFRSAVYGPAAPAYLASTPSLMMRIVGHSAQTGAC